MADSPAIDGGAGVLAGLADPDHRRGNLKLIATAVRRGWIQKPDWFDELPQIMMDIAREKTMTVVTEDGGVIEVPNHRSQIQAAKVLVDMSGQNQQDYWNNDKNERLDAGKATERNAVQVEPVVFEDPVQPKAIEGK